MAAKVIDYSKTIIYKIVFKDINIKDSYVGSTTDFIRRRCDHKRNVIKINSPLYNKYLYKYIRNNEGWDNWEIVEIERYNAVDSNDAFKRERHWLETLGATLNKVIPSRTLKEYREDNKEHYKEYDKELYENNKEYVEEKDKKYYENNEEKLLERRKEKITCVCDSIFSKGNRSKHNKTQKKLFIQNLMIQKIIMSNYQLFLSNSKKNDLQ